MTHTRAKYQAQKLLGSKATVERDGQADTTDRITLPGNTVGNNAMLPDTGYMATTRPHAKLLWRFVLYFACMFYLYVNAIICISVTSCTPYPQCL